MCKWFGLLGEPFCTWTYFSDLASTSLLYHSGRASERACVTSTEKSSLSCYELFSVFLPFYLPRTLSSPASRRFPVPFTPGFPPTCLHSHLPICCVELANRKSMKYCSLCFPRRECGTQITDYTDERELQQPGKGSYLLSTLNWTPLIFSSLIHHIFLCE